MKKSIKKSVLAFCGILSMMSVNAYAYTGSATGKVLLEGGKKAYIGAGVRYTNVDSSRLKVTKSSHKLSDKYPLYFRLRTSSTSAASNTRWSNLVTVKALNTNSTLRYAEFNNSLKNSKWYVWGQTDSTLSDDDTTINCSWEF